MAETEEGPTSWKKIKGMSLQLAVSTAGVSALLYLLGFLALRAKLNFLGVWTDLSLSSQQNLDAAASFLVMAALYALIAVPCLLLLLYLAFLPVQRLLGFRLSWHLRRPFSLRTGMVLFFLFLAFWFAFSQALGLQDALLGACPSGTVQWMVLTPLWGTLLYMVQVLSIAVLALVQMRLWSSVPAGPQAACRILRALFLPLTLASLVLMMMNYGVLVSSRSYRKAELSVTSSSGAAASLSGYPLLQTDQELVLYLPASDEKAWTNRCSRPPDSPSLGAAVVLLPRDTVRRIDFSTISNDPITLDVPESQRMLMMKTFSLMILLLLVSSSLVLAEQVPPVAGTAGSTQQRSPTGTSPERDGKVVTSTSWLGHFFPILRKHGADVLTSLQNVADALRGDEGNGAIDSSTLNVWTYSIPDRTYRQLTQGGGYLYPRASSDGKSVSVLRNGELQVVDLASQKSRTIETQKKLALLLGWREEAEEYLLADGEGRAYLLNVRDGTLDEIALGRDDLRSVTLDRLLTLARTAPSGAEVFDSSAITGTGHEILVDRPGALEAETVLSDGFVNRTPSWLKDGEVIVYVSNRSR